MDDELEPLPIPGLRDHFRTGVDAGVAALPGVGGSLVVLVDAVLAPSISKRREAWFRKLGELLNELSNRLEGWEPGQLAGDEVFVTAIAEASRIAMGTHLEAKLDILKNGLASMALSAHRNDFLDLQLFRFIDELTPEHFLVLQYLSNPGAWFDARSVARPPISIGPPRSIMAHAHLPIDGPSLDIVLRDLSDRGLADTGRLGAMMTEGGMWASRTTELGNDLLGFVRDV